MDEQPGQVIAPAAPGSDASAQPGPQPLSGPALPAALAPAAPASDPAPAAPAPPISTATPAAAQPAGPPLPSLPAASEGGSWPYSGDGTGALPADNAGALPGDISWTAAEFIEHQKNVSWYALLAVIALAVAGTDFLFTRDFISTTAIVLAAAIFGVYAGHKPRTQQYYLSPQGLQIGEKLYGFQGFRNFSVVEEGGLASIVFLPLQRFAPPLTIYVARDLEDRVLDYLSEFLPFEQHRSDAVDGLLRRIRF